MFQSSQQEFDLVQPKPGYLFLLFFVFLTLILIHVIYSWVEQDPNILLSTVLSTMENVVKKSGIKKVCEHLIYFVFLS